MASLCLSPSYFLPSLQQESRTASQNHHSFGKKEKTATYFVYDSVILRNI